MFVRGSWLARHKARIKARLAELAEAEAQQKALAEAKADALADDCVARAITYVRFVSKSKGIRNGKRRMRRNWVEVHLVKYNDGFHDFDKAPLDEWATEILSFSGEYPNGDYPEERLRQRIIDLWGY